MADLDEVRDTFQFLDDWEDRYRFILDLGRSVPQLDAELKTDDRLVRGCQSLVWLVPHFDPDEGCLHLEIDSDAHIVRGLIAIVLAAYDGNEPREILDFDIEGLFGELDLMRHLTPTRGNGLRSMVARIRSVAEDAAAHVTLPRR
ncbi:MAG: SufE family protein [Gammaproteobacteria bacterium]|nr:SufE family protein [Gammaproteobacteria bacterium]